MVELPSSLFAMAPLLRRAPRRMLRALHFLQCKSSQVPTERIVGEDKNLPLKCEVSMSNPETSPAAPSLIIHLVQKKRNEPDHGWVRLGVRELIESIGQKLTSRGRGYGDEFPSH